jgi:arsenate reductase (thioredoxin)
VLNVRFMDSIIRHLGRASYGLVSKALAPPLYPRWHSACLPKSEAMAAEDATGRPQVLFVCVHNAGRSQMAAALLERAARGRVDVRSAGSEPADTLNPAVVAALDEAGIDIRGERPKLLETGAVREADVVITMGCGDTCPVFPGKRYEDWELEDPAGKDLDTVRRIRNEIASRVDALASELVAA